MKIIKKYNDNAYFKYTLQNHFLIYYINKL